MFQRAQRLTIVASDFSKGEIIAQELHRSNMNELASGFRCSVTSPESNNREVKAWWPQHLKRMAFGRSLNYPVGNTVWPESLARFVFGRDFHQAIQGVGWSLDRVHWPSSLQYCVHLELQ